MTLTNEKHEEKVQSKTEGEPQNEDNKNNTTTDDNSPKETSKTEEKQEISKEKEKDSPPQKMNCEECQKNKMNLVNALKHIKTLQGNSTKLIEYYEKVKKEKNTLEENIKKFKTEVTNLQNKLTSNELEKSKLNELLSKSQIEISELKKSSNDTQNSITKIEEMKEENQKLKENFEKSKMDIGNLENKLKMSQKEVEKYKIDFSNYRDQVKNQQRVNKDKINIYEKELKDFKEIKAEYEKELKKNKVLNEKINQLENTVNELKMNEERNKSNLKEDNKGAVNKEMEIKLWKLNNTVTELEQKRMQMELEKNLLFQENLRLSEKIKKVTNIQMNSIKDESKDPSQETSSNFVLNQEIYQRKLQEKDNLIEAEKEKFEKVKRELNEKNDQISVYKRLIEKKTKELRIVHKEKSNLEERFTVLESKKDKLENEFDSKLEKIQNQYIEEIDSYKYTLRHKEEMHQKEKLSLFGIITRQQVEIDDIKNKGLIKHDDDININHSMSIYEPKESSRHELFEREKSNTLKVNTKLSKRTNNEREDDPSSKSKKLKYDETSIKQPNNKLSSSLKEKERLNNRKKKEDNSNFHQNTPIDNDLSDALIDDTDLTENISKKYETIEMDEETNEVESNISGSPKRDLILNDDLINSGQSINDSSSQDKKTTTPISPNQKKRLKAIISIKKRVSNKKYIDIILENKEKNNILEIILNKSIDIVDLKHRIPVFEQFSENINTVMQCLKQHWHKYSSSSSMISPPQMYVPQMWDKKDSSSSSSDNNFSSSSKKQQKDNESSYDQVYGNSEFAINLPFHLPYPEKQALFLIWMLYQYSGKKFIDTILSTISNDIVLIKHTTKDYPYLCCITRAYILLCKNLNEYERARIFCFDLLRESSHGSEIMIHIFANIAKAWPYLLNYSGLLETSYRNNSPTAVATADDKLKSYELFSDEPHTVNLLNNNKESSSDKENEIAVKGEELETPEYYKLKRKVKMVVRLFYQSFEVIICWLYLNMCMERKIDLNHVSVKYLYNIFIKEWKWKQPESSTADLASFIQKLLNLLEDKEIIECIKNVDLMNLPAQPVRTQKDIFASIIRIHLLKSFELICSCFEWSYCHNYVIKVHLWKLLDSNISGYIIELIGKISRSKLTMITEAREGLDTWRSNFSQALSAEQTPLFVQISLVKSIFDIFQGQVEELKPVILWYNKLNKETKKLISPSLLYEIETYKKQYEKELKSLNL
jgi:hypothetical protein